MHMGERIKERIEALVPPTTQKAFAARVGMAPDALSRALGGKRGFASIELVRIAEELGADVHELVTGEPSRHQVHVAARHQYDHATANRSVPTFTDDKRALEDICVAYAQAQIPAREHRVVSGDAEALRAALGEDFARPFADRIEERLQVDVIRLTDLGTAYSGSILGRTFIAIPASGSWFRENWDLAHELAHISGHQSEADANAFAASLLMPEQLLRSINWAEASQEAVADYLWSAGISTASLKIRLESLRLASPGVSAILSQPTQRLLRRTRSWSSSFGDQITWRMDDASRRRFPVELQEAHELAVEEGRLGPRFLAWMRGLDPEWISEAYSPAQSDPQIGDLAEAFGLTVV
ncbi:hypothetical protein CH252_18855 [Rhodococcus sp. 06-1477-1B]|nr:hypothetical protein CH252_18855 [Rhodococcus sp. 06-1477-1B]